MITQDREPEYTKIMGKLAFKERPGGRQLLRRHRKELDKNEYASQHEGGEHVRRREQMGARREEYL